MPTDAVENERKYDAGPSARLPGLAEIPGVAQLAGPHEMFLEATYFDTRDKDLAARGITLRRRTGGADEGWHLKLPLGGDKRQEFQAPLGQPETVPLELQNRLTAYTRGRALTPLARLSTRRAVHGLYGPGGEHLADFADDRVNAENLREAGPGTHWREWEIELVRAASTLFDAAAPVLAAAGAVPATHPAKLARALGDAWPTARGSNVPPPRRKGPVRAVPHSYLAEHISGLFANDAGVRNGNDDAVHAMRSAARRIRSALRTYRPLLEKAPLAGLNGELKWIGRLLGRPRDAEVLRQRILAELPAGQHKDRAVAPLKHELDTAYATGYQRLLAALDSPRYFRLLDALEELLDQPPFKDKAGRPAGRASAKLVNKTARRLDRSHKHARKTPDGPEYSAALHEVRKDAKRLRHAAETVGGIHGKRAKKLRKAAHRVQQVLGEHQDSVVARSFLLGISSGPGTPADVKAACAGLIAVEEGKASRAEKAYRKAFKKAHGLRLD